jgi:hypothetical protein
VIHRKLQNVVYMETKIDVKNKRRGEATSKKKGKKKGAT